MATVMVKIRNEYGQEHLVRALLDPCSQASFISESAAQRLQLSRSSVMGEVKGVGQMTTQIRHSTELEILSTIKSGIKLKLTAYVVRQVTNIMPTKTIYNHNWPHLKNLKLADPTYNKPGRIDLLLRVDVYTEVLMPGLIRGSLGDPIAQETHLG